MQLGDVVAVGVGLLIGAALLWQVLAGWAAGEPQHDPDGQP